MIAVRPETPADVEAVRAVVEAAFEQRDEAGIVERLREGVPGYIGLVAVEGGEVVGHIAFSPVTVERRALPILGLAPMAVRPDWQRRGIGARLVRAGLVACAETGAEAVVVLGHPGYYPRFGFSPAVGFGLRDTYGAPPEAFMALELVPGALGGVSGVVRYASAFAG